MNNSQITFFDTIPDIKNDCIKQFLLKGSGFENGKKRILEEYKRGKPKEFADFLKNEYGIGGFCAKGEWFMHDSTGIEIESKQNDIKVKLNWNEVANKISEYIRNGEYAI